MLMLIDRKEEGLVQLKRALEFESNTSLGTAVNARLTIFNYYVENYEYDLALEIIDNKNIPSDSVNCKKGFVYLLREDYDNAIKYGLKVKNGDTYLSQLNFLNLGKAYYKKGDFINANLFLNKCLTIKTKAYYLAVIQLCRVAFACKEYDKALSYAKSVPSDSQSYEEACTLLFRIYRRLGKIELAKEYMKYIENIYNSAYCKMEYSFITGDYQKTIEYAPFLLANSTGSHFTETLRYYISSLIRLERYDEAKYYIDTIGFELPKVFNDIAMAMINKLTGKQVNESSVYTINQIDNYSEEETINHLIDHHLLNVNIASFTDEESIRKVYSDIKEKIKTTEGYPVNLSDRYFIPYTGVGFDKDGALNTLEVITIMGTKDILTMYPLSGVDINLENENKQHVRVKRESQIDKFYRKYGKQ